MLSYDEALARILDAVPGPLSTRRTPITPLGPILGRILAADVPAPLSLPPFANSAVDGYAVRMADTAGASEASPVRLRVTGTVAAGSISTQPVRPGTAQRILTGASVPEGADAIVMVEDTSVERAGDRETVVLRDPGSPRYIRAVGSDVRQGVVALPAGMRLDAGAVGLLTSLGVRRVPLYRLPTVNILTTGDELYAGEPEGGALPPGLIYDSNGPALSAAVLAAGGKVGEWFRVPDEPEAMRSALRQLGVGDVVVASGGVSVGERDYVKSVVEEIGQLDFWRIAIRPGKPLAFGRVGNALFFGLPGNPVSSLVTFELFVRPVLRKLAGHSHVTRPLVEAMLTAPLPHEPGRREFARAHLEWKNGGYHATPTGAQGSHRLSSLLGADALLVASEDRGDYAAGERLSALLLAG